MTADAGYYQRLEPACLDLPRSFLTLAMVLPLLYGLSAKDFLEPKGFLLLTCQKCKSSGPFAVFDSKRKVTLYSIPTFSVREQMVSSAGPARSGLRFPRKCGKRFSTRC